MAHSDGGSFLHYIPARIQTIDGDAKDDNEKRQWYGHCANQTSNNNTR